MITKERDVKEALEIAVPLSIHLWARSGGQNMFGKACNVTRLQ